MAICWAPVAASVGTVILTCVLLTLVTPASWAEPIHAAVMPDRLVPVMVKTLPTGPDVGEIELMLGCKAACAAGAAKARSKKVVNRNLTRVI